MTSLEAIGSESTAISRWLGVDFGLKRCGFALSDPSASLASPLIVLPTEPRHSLPAGLLLELTRKGIALGEFAGIICGLPLSERGKETEMSGFAREAVLQLQAALTAKLPSGQQLALEFADERLSSREMLARGGELGIRGNERKRNIDAWAATSILQGWLDYQRTQPS